MRKPRRKKAKLSLKFTAPPSLQLMWPLLPEDKCSDVQQLLHRFFEPLRNQIEAKLTASRDAHRQRQLAIARTKGKRKSAQTTELQTPTQIPKPDIPRVKMLPGVHIGVNACSRLMSNSTKQNKANLAMLIVCRDADPPLLVAHLGNLAALHQIPVCPVKGIAGALGRLIGLKSCLAIGFEDSPQNNLVVEGLRAIACVPEMPWLDPDYLIRKVVTTTTQELTDD